MGKARIEENKEHGLYAVTMILTDPQGVETDGETVDALCVDYTVDLLVGEVVGTLDIGGVNGEFRDGNMIRIYRIKPGYSSDEEVEHVAEWAEEDGIYQSPQAMSPSGFYWNATCLPAWQKWKPTARTGIISDIDYEKHTASVCMRPVYSPTPFLNMGASQLEPEELPECDLDEGEIPSGPYWEAFQNFCEAYPDHPVAQPVPSRTNADHDQWWATVVEINTTVNQGMTYARDGAEDEDIWDVVSLPGSGDCEDYGLTKLQMLADRGFPVTAMGLAVGKLGSGPTRGGMWDIDHAWAVVWTTRGLFHLDQAPNVPTGSQPGSNFFVLRKTGVEITARKLTDVPIDYMDCHSEVFVDGDNVVVAFEDQSWDTPKIVGFRNGPRPCGQVKLVAVPLVQFIRYSVPTIGYWTNKGFYTSNCPSHAPCPVPYVDYEDWTIWRSMWSMFHASGTYGISMPTSPGEWDYASGAAFTGFPVHALKVGAMAAISSGESIEEIDADLFEEGAFSLIGTSSGSWSKTMEFAASMGQKYMPQTMVDWVWPVQRGCPEPKDPPYGQKMDWDSRGPDGSHDVPFFDVNEYTEHTFMAQQREEYFSSVTCETQVESEETGYLENVVTTHSLLDPDRKPEFVRLKEHNGLELFADPRSISGTHKDNPSHVVAYNDSSRFKLLADTDGQIYAPAGFVGIVPRTSGGDVIEWYHNYSKEVINGHTTSNGRWFRHRDYLVIAYHATGQRIW